jgi:hypothetical protein
VLGLQRPADANGTITQMLLVALKSGDQDLKQSAAEALRLYGFEDKDGSIGEAVLNSVSAGSFELTQTLLSLKPIFSAEALSPLLDHLVDRPDPEPYRPRHGMGSVAPDYHETRRTAASVLGRWRSTDANEIASILRALSTSILNDSYTVVRTTAAEALRSLKPNRKNDEIWAAVFAALKNRETWAPAVIAALKPNDEDGIIAKLLVGNVKKVVDDLRIDDEGRQDETPYSFAAAVAEALGKLNPEDKDGNIAKELLEQLKIANPVAPKALALLKIKSAVVIGALLDSLNSDNDEIAQSSAEALGALKADDTNGTITEALLRIAVDDKRNYSVRATALNAIGSLKPKENGDRIRQALLAAFKYDNPEYRDHAKKMLSDLEQTKIIPEPLIAALREAIKGEDGYKLRDATDAAFQELTERNELYARKFQG